MPVVEIHFNQPATYPSRISPKMGAMIWITISMRTPELSRVFQHLFLNDVDQVPAESYIVNE